MTKHTPTPWWTESERRPEKHGDQKTTITQKDFDIASCFGTGETAEDGANAAHIVHCVNLHDELVAALENLVAVSEPDETGFVCTSDVERVLDEARGVLYKNKAEGNSNV